MSVDTTQPGSASVAAATGRSRTSWLLVVLLLAVIVAAGAWWWLRESAPAPIVEYKMLVERDIPTGIAVAPDGSVWFSIDFSDAVGVLRNGKIERFTKRSNNVDALGIGVDANGNAWFADAPAVAIQRFSSNGEQTKFPLDTPIARLGRLAVAPDGAVWFAEGSYYSITRLKDGVLKRHPLITASGGPYGVAVARDGNVWATLQGGNRIVHITPEGELTEHEIPTRSSAPTDIAVDANGTVWFLEFRGNKIGRFENGKFSEFPVPADGAGLTGIAVAPDGAIWFGMLRAHKLGRLRDGKLKVFELPRGDARPYSVAADATGNIWYTDIRGYIGMLPAKAAAK